MMQEIYAEYREYDQKYAARKKQLEQLISKHTSALERLENKHQSWFDRVLVPLAVHISAEMGGLPYKFYGPFGLRAEVSVYFFPTAGRDILRDETYSLTVCPEWNEDGFRLMYDTGARKYLYAPGSIGSLNGFNNVTAELPDSMEEIMALLQHSHYEKGERT